jgi:hypothetical protein
MELEHGNYGWSSLRHITRKLRKCCGQIGRGSESTSTKMYIEYLKRLFSGRLVMCVTKLYQLYILCKA